MVRDFPAVTEKHLRLRLEARLGQDLQVRCFAEQIVLDDLVVRRTGQTVSDFREVSDLLLNVTQALLHSAYRLVTSHLTLFVSLLRRQS